MPADETTDREILTHHLPYEFAMLRGTYDALAAGGHAAIVENALIESFCIHARLLMEFFNSQQGCKAKEFTGGAYTPVHLGGMGEAILNTQIAHITRRRTANPSKKIGPADRRRWLDALEREAQEFAAQLAPQFRGMFIPPKPQVSAPPPLTAPSATNMIATTSSASVIVSSLASPTE